jgi:hypothetical protein
LSWNPSSSSNINTISILGDNIYIGGNFTAVSGGTVRNRAAAFNTSGTLLAWDPNINQATTIVNGIVTRGDNVYLAGTFTSVAGSTVTRSYFAAYDTSGTLLSARCRPGGVLRGISIDNSHIYLAGSFSSFANHPDNSPNMNVFAVARIDYQGRLDDSFRMNSTGEGIATGEAATVEVDGDRILVGGSFYAPVRPAVGVFDKTTGARVRTDFDEMFAQNTAFNFDNMYLTGSVVGFMSRLRTHDHTGIGPAIRTSDLGITNIIRKI